MKTVSILDLLKSGAHFGQVKSKRYPKMNKYIFGVKDGVHIIDLEKTIESLEKASEFIKKVVSKNGKILFIGTKRQAKAIVKEFAEDVKMPYVISRWLGGTFTNFENIIRLPHKMKKLEEDVANGVYDKYTKKEKLMIDREIEKLKEMVEGIRDLDAIPQAIFVVDINHEKTAVMEARERKIPIIAIADTNTNPELVDYPIPANDDSINTLKLILSVFKESIDEVKK
ncbi:MAG TPA: 30S ribosomal protein S2 [bacterium]|jgi:small subunit ribosomal protein S2|nr:30S ribosomal protein S2 [bacterium]HOG38722.1 30S ribosomal protein S2 [bacterium]HQI03602.1 30S ribosomal protein S2 [bacterium]